MVYMGSKNRIAKDLLPIITKYLTKDRWYVEPFCGGCNMIDKVKHDKRIANDYNKYLIALFKALQDGIELPNQITKEMFAEARDNFHGKKETMTLYLIGWIGFMAGFSGRFFDGGYAGHDFKGRDYVKEDIACLVSEAEMLKQEATYTLDELKKRVDALKDYATKLSAELNVGLSIEVETEVEDFELTRDFKGYSRINIMD